MTKQVVSNWYNKLGQSERNLPLLIYQGNVYTPQVAYDEVMRGSPLGDALQSLIEKQSFGTSAEDEQTVAKLRLTEIMRTKPDKPLFATLSNKIFTPSQLLEEIQKGTAIGQQWVATEISHMKRIVAVR
jgi:predicted RNase H-like nuclease (RuvC/YqgF family)